LFTDHDGDGQFDPGDVITTRIRVTVSPGDDAQAVQVTVTTDGLTVDGTDPNAVQITPIAFDDALPSITGNTPMTFTAAQLLGNDVDPDGAEINLSITGVSGASNGTIVNNGNGTFTFTPTTGYVGTASFQYTIQDEDGLASVSTGIVSFNVTDPVWYVNNATGSDTTGDGSYANPFASLAPLSTGGSADGLDNADDTIFVYNTGIYGSGIVLETGQKLFGDGHAFSVNGLSIGASSSNSTINYSGIGITLATNNTIMGVTLNGTGASAVGIQDNGNVGTLVIDETSIIGQGKAVDIDSGGTLNVDLDQLSSLNSTTEGVHLQGVTGTFSAATGTIETAVGASVLIGAAGGATAGSGGDVNFTYGGAISIPIGNGVEIQDRTGGTVTFSGAIGDNAINAGQTGILIDGSAGTINFNGPVNLNAGAGGGNGVTLTSNSATINFAAGGTGLDIATTSGTGLTFTGGGTLNVTGAGNSVTTTTGQILNLHNGAMGTSGIAFSTLTSGTVANGNAININNLDAAGSGAFSGGTVSIAGTAGAGADGISITGGSDSTFTFTSATIGGGAAGTNPISGDGIELNGANGTVTFATVTINGTAGSGVSIINATNAVNINGGSIGGSNDPGGDGVRISGGTGAVTVAASIAQSTGGNHVVDISGHGTGAISFSGNLTAGAGGGGISIANNSSGNIGFTGTNVTLNTGALDALVMVSSGATGANVTFSGGNLDIDTTSGRGISATGANGTLTITGANNTIASGTGTALNVVDTSIGLSGLTFLSIGTTAASSSSAIVLSNTGTSAGTHGGLTITGADGGDPGTAADNGTGGTISNKSVDSIVLTNTRGVVLNGVTVTNNTGGSWIDAENVIGLTLNNFNGNNSFDDGIEGTNLTNLVISGGKYEGGGTLNGVANFDGISITNLLGNSSITGATFERANTRQIYIVNNQATNFAGTADRLTVSGNTFQNHNVSPFHGDHLSVSADTGGNFRLVVDNSAGSGNIFRTAGIAVQASGAGSGKMEAIISHITSGGTLASGFNNTAAVVVAGTGTSTVKFNVSNNTSLGTGSVAMSFNDFTSGDYSGTIANNNITHIAGAGTDALQILSHGNGNGTGTADGVATVAVLNNNIEGNFQRGIRAQAAFDQAVLNLNISGNTVHGTDPTLPANGGLALRAIEVEVGGSGGTTSDKIFLNLENNNAWMDNGNAGYRLFNRGTGTFTFSLEDYAGGPNDSAAITNWIDNVKANNSNGGPATTLISGASSGYSSHANTPAPVLAAAPPPVQEEEPLAVIVEKQPQVVDDSRVPTVPDDDGGTQTSDPIDNRDDTPASTPPQDPVPADQAVLTQANLDLLVEAAIQRWIGAGATAPQVEAMRAVLFGIVDMAGIFVGSSTIGVINIDNDAAGHGWFVDMTPGEDSEYGGSGTRLTADAGGPAAGRVDLLTVLMHELGHQIGLGDEYSGSSASELMYGYVNSGERRLPAAGEAAGAIPGSVGATSYAMAPVAVGTIPAGKTVDVFIKATINDQRNNFIANLVNTVTIKGSNFADQIFQEILALDTLTLGNMVFLDVNRDGDYDGGTDTGLVGVIVDLYADTNDSGGWDAGDAFLGTTTTAAGGLYSFAGLAPGDYVVVIKSTNFDSGGKLEGLVVTPGTATDPDDNIDGDNNGAAVAGGAVASKTITLSYNNEGSSFTPGAGVTGEDMNNTVDFAFVANAPPVANDDAVTVAEDSGANDLTSQVLGNDTDPEGDTRTVASATHGANGTTSVVNGVLTYTPNANYAGTDSFTYTIEDGNGNSETGTVTVTVTAVNDAPVNSLGGTIATTEDSVDVALTGMSISDVDADPATDVMYFTFLVTNGALKFRYDVAGGIVRNDVLAEAVNGDAFTIVTTLNKMNATLAASDGLTYTPNANFNGSDTLTVYANDGGVTGVDPGVTGDGTSEEDVDTRTITVSAVNDAPVVIGDGTVDAAPIVEDTPGPGETVNSLFVGRYSDAIDAQSSAGNPGGSSPGAFTGVAVVDNGSSAATGQWQYYNPNTMLWVDVGARSTASALLIASATLIRFDPALDFTGAAPTLTVHLIDNSLGYGITFGQVVDISGVGATGGTTPYSTGTVVLNQDVTVANLAPTVDLDGDDSVSVGTGFASAYTEGGAAAAISDIDVTIADGDPGDDIVSATITITNAEAGDILNVNLATLPATVTIDGTSTATTVKLVAAPGTSAADFEAAIRSVTYSNTEDDPTTGGTNTARTITVVVNDGVADSVAATATVTVTDDNADAPFGTNATITAVEDTFRLIEAADLGFTDADGTFANVTISAVSGGGIYFDADGSAGAGAPVLATLPATYTAQDLADGKVAFLAGPNANGSGIGTITFAVTDDDGNVAASANTLTVDVTAVNDSPVLTTGGPIAATEQTAVAILPAGSVADVDLDARNGGAGDYAGAQFSVNRNPATNATEDVFTLVAGPNFTIDGSTLKSGGQIFGTINVNGSAGLIVITFTSQETIATSALVDEVIQSVRYTNTSDDPPASVDLAVGFQDGSPGGGQGSGATDLDVNLVTVNIAGVNDAPVNSLGGTVSIAEDSGATELGGMSISDPDADPATDKMYVTFQVASGALTIRFDVAGGIVANDLIANAEDWSLFSVLATLDKINATLSASNA
jgi:hypothetical protein